MLKRILAVAIVAAFFACSSSDDDGEEFVQTNPRSSSSGDPSSSSDGNSPPDGNSSSGEASSSSSVTPVFELLHDFSERDDNTIGYAQGQATVGNDDDMFENSETGELECEIDPDTEVCFKNWVPNGIFTLKDFSYNDGTTENSSGGLIIRGLGLVKEYAQFKFNIRSTATGTYEFRLKAEREVGGKIETGAWAKEFTISEANVFETITIEINESWKRLYSNLGLPNQINLDYTAEGTSLRYALDNSQEIEFVIPFGLASGDNKQTLEIDDFYGLKK